MDIQSHPPVIYRLPSNFVIATDIALSQGARLLCYYTWIMDHCSDDLCSKCLELLNNRAIWHDSFSQKKKRTPALLDERRYREIDESSVTCRLCRLVQAALTRYSVDPELDDIIYYARILFARFKTKHSHSTDTIRPTSHNQQAGRADFCYTYRLRVSANIQYDIDLKGNIEDVRDWQSRSCEEHCISSYPYFEGDIMMLREQADDDRFSNGRRIGTCLDFNLAKRWISDCVTKHGPIEQRGAFSKQISPNRVIDVCSRKIIRAPQECLYAALSYCWGPKKIPQVRLNKLTENDLEKPEGLNDFPIPKTLLDAILVCEKLGIDYLWVDALCRPQGEEGEYKQESMENISDIFACAYLTIVGGGADSHHGLPGSGHSSPRQCSERIGDLHLAISQPHIDEAMQHSLWIRRAWPYDEKVRSKRLLIFSDYQVFFTCNCPGESPSIYCEDIHLESSPHDSIGIKDLDLPPIDDPWNKLDVTDFYPYLSEVKQYVRREITKPEDRKRAFNGVKQRMEPGIGKKYFHDLPVRYFARAMCFELETCVYRRTAYGSPSWSWQGWDIHSSDNFDYDSAEDMDNSDYDSAEDMDSSDHGSAKYMDNLYYDSAEYMGFHISIFYRAEKQSRASQFHFIPFEDYELKDHFSNNEVLIELLKDIRGPEFIEADRRSSKSTLEWSLPGDSSNPNVRSMIYREVSPTSEVLDTLSAEEKSHIVAFYTVTTDLFFSSLIVDGYQQIKCPGREGEKLGQGWLNAEAGYRTGVFKCIFIGASDLNGYFFLVVKEVKENVYSRVGSCLVDTDVSKLDETEHGLEMVYLI